MPNLFHRNEAINDSIYDVILLPGLLLAWAWLLLRRR